MTPQQARKIVLFRPLIEALAAGKKIQVGTMVQLSDGQTATTWVDCSNPDFIVGDSEGLVYRFKPTLHYYRISLHKNGESSYISMSRNAHECTEKENCESFVKWLTPWLALKDEE